VKPGGARLRTRRRTRRAMSGDGDVSAVLARLRAMLPRTDQLPGLESVLRDLELAAKRPDSHLGSPRGFDQGPGASASEDPCSGRYSTAQFMQHVAEQFDFLVQLLEDHELLKGAVPGAACYAAVVATLEEISEWNTEDSGDTMGGGGEGCDVLQFFFQPPPSLSFHGYRTNILMMPWWS